MRRVRQHHCVDAARAIDHAEKRDEARVGEVQTLGIRLDRSVLAADPRQMPRDELAQTVIKEPCRVAIDAG